MGETDTASSPADIHTPIPYKAEVLRKAIHLLALVLPLAMVLLGKTEALYLLVPTTALVLSGDVLRVRSVWFARLVARIFGFLMRSEEQPPVGGSIKLTGATWVLLSATLLTVVFPIRIAAPALAIFMLSDAAAALVGRRYGRTHWGDNPRTLEGSLAFLLVGLGVMALVAPYAAIVFWTGAVSVVAATLAEVPTGPFNDNLRVPMVAAAVLFILERFVLGIDVGLF
ncbi:MAG: diacylglycerol/polyprenol kinase family protein [Rhodothermales bacterium]